MAMSVFLKLYMCEERRVDCSDVPRAVLQWLAFFRYGGCSIYI